jgi:hypothetical protein
MNRSISPNPNSLAFLLIEGFTQEQLTALTPHIVGLVNDAQDAIDSG